MTQNKFASFVVFASIYLLQCHYGLDTCRKSDRGTDNLQESVIGLCTKYQQYVNPDVFCNEGYRNCTEIWEAFRDSFAFQPLCNVSMEKMSRYVRLTYHSIPRDKILFWENVYPFVKRYANSGKKFMAVSDTLMGYIGDEIQWCSNEHSPTGMYHSGESCPGYDAEGCEMNAQRTFWMAVSKSYAETSRGEIYILYNASVTPIFDMDTYFAKYEFPNIPEKEVHKATVLLLNESPSPSRSACDDPSLDLLEQLFKDRKIQYSCIENRIDLVMTYCIDNPSRRLCDVFNQTTNNSLGVYTYSWILFFMFSSSVVMSFLGRH